jgi:hypothetical protein
LAIRPALLIDRHDLLEHHFIGGDGERVTTNADKLLSLVAKRCGPSVAAVFALSRFNELRSSVAWFAHEDGAITPFTELSDDEQEILLRQLDEIRSAVLELARDIGDHAAETGPDARRYALLLPMLLHFPAPVEYHLYRWRDRPLAICWGMNKDAGVSALDTVGPFIEQWHARIEQRRHQVREATELRAREETFLGRLTRAGARSGAVTVSLIWNDLNDLDLHVICPTGERISFECKQALGGILDVDRNAHATALTQEPVENIVWTRAPAVRGCYAVGVHFFRRHDPDVIESRFTLRIATKGRMAYHEGQVAPGEYKEIATFGV